MCGRLLPNILILRIFLLEGVWSHGRMIEPPMRSSIWRFGFNSEPNYTDNELNCGGFVNQYEKNNGKCGVCGDPYQGPRDNEAGGKYARGIIVRHYSAGQIIEVTVELTANHQGYFEFRICPHDDVTHPATQECLNKTLLTIIGHGTRYYIQNDIRQQFVHLLVQLPPDMTCTQCVLQWKYVAGNNKGSGAGYEDCYGCGPQEHFINCADVAIYSQSVQQQATLPAEFVLDDSLESTSIIEYFEKMKNSHTNRMVDFDFLADFLSVDMEDDFWEDMQLFLDSSAEPLKAIVTNTAVSMFPANKDGITKFHHLVKLSLLFQGVAPPSNARKISKALIDSESSSESRFDTDGDNSDTSSDSGNKAIVSKDKGTSKKQGKSINFAKDKIESHDSWADSVSKDSSEFPVDSSSSKSDSSLSHLESQSSDSRDISESSDESNDKTRIGTRISSVDNERPGKKRTANVSKDKTLPYDNISESSDDSSSSVEDSWDEASKDTDDQSKSSGERSKTETSDNGKDGDSGENHSDTKSKESSSDSREYLEDSESDSTESLNDSKDKNGGQFNTMSDDSGSQSKKEDNSIDSEDSWDMSREPEGDSINSLKESKESKGRKGESKETEHQGSDTSKNINGDSNESEKTDRDKGKNSREKDSNEIIGSKGRDEEEGKESVGGEKQKDAKDSRERETNKSKIKDYVDSKIDDIKDSKGNLVSAVLSDVEAEAPEIEFKKPEIEVEKLELDVEAPDLKDAFGNLKDTIKLEDEKLVAAAVMSGSEQNTMDKGKGQGSISNLLARSIVAAGPQILSSKSSALEEQLRSALVTVFLENHNPSLGLCKDGETKARCGCTENWSKYPLVDMYCTSLCPYGYCPTYLCQCSCPKICRGLDHLVQLTAAINQWCKANCGNGQCPSHMCICD